MALGIGFNGTIGANLAITDVLADPSQPVFADLVMNLLGVVIYIR